METEDQEAELTTCQKELLRIQRDYEAYNRGELPWDDFMKIRDKYILDNDEWRYDTIPEIYNGMNVADFVDANIEEKLAALEREEEELLLTETTDIDPSMFLPPEEQEVYDEIVNAQGVLREVSRVKKGTHNTQYDLQTRGRSRDLLAEHLEDLGVDSETAKAKAASVKTRHRSRTPSTARGRPIPFMDDEDAEEGEDRSRSRSRRRSSSLRLRRRSNSLIRQGGEASMPTQEMRDKAERLRRMGIKMLQRQSKTGEADHRIDDLRPKHLLSGKRKNGTHDRR